MIVHVAEAAAALQAHDDILILTHRRPDGDTAGCAGALCRGLRQIGKRAYILENPEITRRYAPMITDCYPPDDFNPQYIVSTDIAEEKLFPDTAEQYKGRVDLVIDHHGSNEGFGAKNLIRADAGACAEVLYDVLTALGCRLTREIAECIYVGVSTDTGCFKFSKYDRAHPCGRGGVPDRRHRRRRDQPRAVRDQVASALRDGAHRIRHDGVSRGRRDRGRGALAEGYRPRRRGYGRSGLDRFAHAADRGRADRHYDDRKGGRTVRVSVRTTKEMDASAICKRVGGGGHVRAAGASFTCGMARRRPRCCA